MRPLTTLDAPAMSDLELYLFFQSAVQRWVRRRRATPVAGGLLTLATIRSNCSAA